MVQLYRILFEIFVKVLIWFIFIYLKQQQLQKQKGNVLIPTLPTGKIYDLVECLYRYLNDSGMQSTPVYFVSSVADQSLAFSNIFAEWLCEPKQALVYAAESPFQHGELTRTGLLKCYSGINAKFNDDFHQPCILFASHPSLRFFFHFFFNDLLIYETKLNHFLIEVFLI